MLCSPSSVMPESSRSNCTRFAGKIPALGRDDEERKRIRLYRKAVESAAAGKLGDSFERLDKMGAVVACGLGDQADKLADEYLRLAEQRCFGGRRLADVGGSPSRQLARA